MDRSGKMVIFAVVGLIIALLVIVFVGFPIAKIILSTSSSIESLGYAKCNENLDQRQYADSIIKFSPKTYSNGQENIFYEPKIAALNFIGYLECRDDKGLYNLDEATASKLDEEITKCGNEAFKNYLADLKAEIKQNENDPEMEGYADELKDERKLVAAAYEKYLKHVKIPEGRCEFKADI